MALDCYRRMAVLNIYCRIFDDLADEATRKLLAALNTAYHVQVLDGCVAYHVEGSDSFCRLANHIESYCMAVAVERAAIGSVALLANHDGTSINIGHEHGVHVSLPLGFLHHLGEFPPVVDTANEDCSRRVLSVVNRRGLGIDGLAFLHPRTNKLRQQVVQRGLRIYSSGLHLGHGLAVDNRPVVLA